MRDGAHKFTCNVRTAHLKIDKNVAEVMAVDMLTAGIDTVNILCKISFRIPQQLLNN